jgi:hypothetical protein
MKLLELYPNKKKRVMVTFNQNNQKISGNQYNIAGNAVINIGQIPNILQSIIPEIEKAQETGSISQETATDVKNEVENALAESKRSEPDTKTIIEKLNGAKALIEGVSSAGDLVKIIIESIEMVRKFIL